MNQDPLSDLLLDASEVDRASLANALRDILGVDNDTGRIVLKPGFSSLASRSKVLAYLLGKKAALLLGKADREEVAAKTIPIDTGIPSGTVHPKLKELRENHFVSQTDDGHYYIASHQLLDALDELERGKKSQYE